MAPVRAMLYECKWQPFAIRFVAGAHFPSLTPSPGLNEGALVKGAGRWCLPQNDLQGKSETENKFSYWEDM